MFFNINFKINGLTFVLPIIFLLFNIIIRMKKNKEKINDDSLSNQYLKFYFKIFNLK